MQHVAGTKFSRIHQNSPRLLHRGAVPVCSTPEEFGNGGFTLKTHQMFSVHITPEEYYNATITGHFVLY